MAVASEAQTPLAMDRDTAIKQYAPLVKYVVGRLAIGLPAILDYEDILSYGTIGLSEALDRYDGSKGVKFETYCVPRIRGAMLDELRTMDWVPRLVRSKASKLNEATKMLEARLGRHPTEGELAKQLEISVEDLDEK